MRIGPRLGVVGVCCLGALACMMPKGEQKQQLPDSIRGYAEGLRWQHYPGAANYIAPKERQLFLGEREEK